MFVAQAIKTSLRITPSAILFVTLKQVNMRILLASALLFLISCNSVDKKEDAQVAGAWKMLSQNMKSEKTDTTYTSIQQRKIFTGDHMMYANVNPAETYQRLKK